MSAEKKKTALVSITDIDKALTTLIKSAIESMTQLHDEVTARVGCFSRRIIRIKPTQVTQLAYIDVTRIIRDKMPLTSNCQIKVCDAFITTYPDMIFEKFMSYASLYMSNTYIAEQYDCDDFSITFASIARKWHARIRAKIEADEINCSYLPEAPRAPSEAHVIPHIPAASAAPNAATHYIGGSPVGMCQGRISATSEQHAFNFWISPQSEVFFIEPQTGEFVVLGEGAFIDYVYI